jgi:hypothetical protein
VPLCVHCDLIRRVLPARHQHIASACLVDVNDICEGMCSAHSSLLLSLLAEIPLHLSEDGGKCHDGAHQSHCAGAVLRANMRRKICQQLVRRIVLIGRTAAIVEERQLQCCGSGAIRTRHQVSKERCRVSELLTLTHMLRIEGHAAVLIVRQSKMLLISGGAVEIQCYCLIEPEVCADRVAIPARTR